MAQLRRHDHFIIYRSFKIVDGKQVYYNGHTTDQMHFLDDSQGRRVEVATSYFQYLILEKAQKALYQSAFSLKRYWEFLEQHDMRWDEMPYDKSQRPTYAYHRSLKKQLHQGEIKKSTASAYMRGVIQFYKYVMSEGLVSFSDDCMPFRAYQTKVPARSDAVFQIFTTDLRFHGFQSSEPQLAAMGEETQRAFEQELKRQPPVFRMLCELATRAGLRISEATSLTLSAVKTARQSAVRPDHVKINIGPEFGMKTKFSKSREVEVPRDLFSAIQRYITSEAFLELKHKLKDNAKHIPVFITKRGTRYNQHTLYAHWYKFKAKLASLFKLGFNVRFHDLRATFALNFMKSDDLNGLGEEHKASYLQRLLGHSSGFTTFMYTLLINNDLLKAKNNERKEQLMDELCGGMRVRNAW